MSQVCDNKDQKSFWSFLKGSRSSLPLDISAEDCFNYFANVYNPDDVQIMQVDEIQDHIVDETSGATRSYSEVFLATEKLKNDKSPGLDGIPAEFY